MTLQLLHSEFPYICGNFDFFFISVYVSVKMVTEPIAYAISFWERVNFFSFIVAVTKYTKLWVFMDALQRKSISERQLKPIETTVVEEVRFK